MNSRPTAAVIDLDILRQNFTEAREIVGPDVRIMAMVKADAYGHGAIECARSLEQLGADWFGVATVEEGVELRRSGITAPILSLGGFWPGQELLLVDLNITPVIFRLDQAERLDHAVSISSKKNFAIHLKIDTGLGRVGLTYDGAAEFADRLRSFDHLTAEGIMTHFAAADDLDQKVFTSLQVERFDRAVNAFEGRGFRFRFKDMANSAATVLSPGTHRDMVRLGGILYGLTGDTVAPVSDRDLFKPVLSLSTAIAHIKEVNAGETLGYGRTFTALQTSLIATLPVGYGDGYPRALSNCGSVLIDGDQFPIVGRISMDWTIVDITKAPHLKVGDRVTLIGESKGRTINAEDIARLSGKLSYEVITGLTKRVPREYRGD